MTTTAIKEHPILFSGRLVRAILDGRKTQTRRVCRDQDLVEYWKYLRGEPVWPQKRKRKKLERYTGWVAKYKDLDLLLPRTCPYGEPGHRLWVRETWADESDGTNCPDDTGVLYRATDPGWDDNDTGLRWKPSIFMPRSASRITLEVERIRVERLQQITREDVRAEGVPDTWGDWPSEDLPEKMEGHEWDNKTWAEQWAWCWDSINAKRGFGWEKNPWIWVVDFSRVEEDE